MNLVGKPYPVKCKNEVIGVKLITKSYPLADHVGYVVLLSSEDSASALIMSLEESKKYEDPNYLKNYPILQNS